MKNFQTGCLLFITALLCACAGDTKKSQNEESSASGPIVQSSPKAEKFTQADTLKAVAQEVILAFEREDYSELIKYFSQEGVLFSPYAYLEPKKQVKLTAEEFMAAIQSKKVMKWGQYDGTGDPINLSAADFIKKFITKANFSNAEAISFNAKMKKGNTIDNIDKVFPKADYVEYHFSGLDPQYQGMDWTSLRLVFERIDGEYFLVAVVQDQWTV